MTDKLKEFLTWNRACIEGLDRLAATGAKTLEEAWAAWAAWAAQAKWVRENFRLCDLNTK